MMQNRQKRDQETGHFVAEKKPKLVTISTKVTENERDRIAHSAAHYGMTVSEYLKWCVLLQEWQDAKARVTGADYLHDHPVTEASNG